MNIPKVPVKVYDFLIAIAMLFHIGALLITKAVTRVHGINCEANPSMRLTLSNPVILLTKIAISWAIILTLYSLLRFNYLKHPNSKLHFSTFNFITMFIFLLNLLDFGWDFASFTGLLWGGHL